MGLARLVRRIYLPAGVLHDPDLRPVYGLQTRVFVRVLRPTEYGLPVAEIADGHQRLFLPGIGDGDPADGEVELPGQRVLRQRGPRSLHIFKLHAERCGQILGKLCIKAGITAGFRIQV